MIFADGHVHIYDCYDVDLLFDSALNNFQAAARSAGQGLSSYVLLLTTGRAENGFRNTLAGFRSQQQTEKEITARWHGTYSAENGSLKVTCPDIPGEELHLVEGRQVVTSEGIEVLALFCGQALGEGQPLAETVETVRKQDGIPVLPWGVGKWLGRRGKIIESFIRMQEKGILFVGDNGGRPRIWPDSKLFAIAGRMGIAVMPGTDPLPLPGEARRIGSFGFSLNDEVPPGESPVTILKRGLLSGKCTITPYGNLLNTGTFLVNQLRLRFSAGV